MTNKEQIEKILKDINREGMADLMAYLDEAGFYTAPCSTRYHLAKEGGLAEHSLNVCNYALSIAGAWVEDLTDELIESIKLCAILHDVGKCGDFGLPLYTEKVLKSGKPAAQPYQHNPDLLAAPHEITSLKIAERFIRLTADESWAILMHNGLYGDLKYKVQGHETPLYMIIHFADMWVSRVTEVEEKEEE